MKVICLTFTEMQQSIAKACYTAVIGMYTHNACLQCTWQVDHIIIIIIPGMFKTLHFNTTLMYAQHRDRMSTGAL